MNNIIRTPAEGDEIGTRRQLGETMSASPFESKRINVKPCSRKAETRESGDRSALVVKT